MESELLRACRDGNAADLQKFVEVHSEKEDYDICDENEECGPLHFAVEANSVQCVKILLATQLVHVPSSSSYWLHDQIIYLDLATRKESFEIVGLLLRHDPNFYWVKWFSMLALSAEMLAFYIDTLEEMGIASSSNFIKFEESILRICTIHEARSEHSIRIFKRLIALTEQPSKLMQHMFDFVHLNALYTDDTVFKYCMKNWHLTEQNEHHALVRKLLDNPDIGLSPCIIFTIHSGIKIVEIESIDRIFNSLLETKLTNSDIVKQVMNILWSKVDREKLNSVFYRNMYQNGLRNSDGSLKLSVEWLDITGIGHMVHVNLWQIPFDMLHVLMPFSNQVTADYYVLPMWKTLNNRKAIIQRELARTQPIPDDEFVISSRLLAEDFWKLDNDDLSKFCVNGIYRSKSTLKSLCRAKIRRVLLQPTFEGSQKTNQQLIADIRSLELPESFKKYSNSRNLPKSIQQFLLFNHSEYQL